MAQLFAKIIGSTPDKPKNEQQKRQGQKKIHSKNGKDKSRQESQESTSKASINTSQRQTVKDEGGFEDELFQRTGSKKTTIKNEIQPKSATERTQRFISQFLDYEVYKSKNLNPEFLRIKNNILLIIFVLSSFGIYYLFENFIDVMLLAFIGGVGYQQMRERFIKFWSSDEPFFQKQMTMAVRILSIIGYLLIIFVLPWVRSQIGYPEELQNHLTMTDIIDAFTSNINIVVLILQIILLSKVLHLILAPKVLPIIARNAPKNMIFYKWTFGIIFTILILAALLIIPAVLAMEVSHGGYLVEKKVEESLKCRLINYSNYNSTSLPSCSEIFFQNNTFFEETLKQFKAQTSQVQDCMMYLSQLQRRIIGYESFKYKEIACTSYLIILKASYYFTPNTDMLATGTTFLKTIFGNLALIIMSLSNIVFSLTSFATIFYSTVSYFNPRSTVMQEIFFGQRKELLGQITNLIEATLYIVFQHFLLSIILLQLFNFSNFNMVLSTFLSSMAFVPFFRPSFGVLFFCIVRSLLVGNYVVNILFFIVYNYISERIFTSRLKPMQFHEIITNMSILFGIYQFGIAGIFYGPMIIILFRSVHRELLRNEVYTQQ